MRRTKTRDRIDSLGQKVCMVVVIRQLVQERTRFQDKGRQDNLGQVHPWPDLLQQCPDQTFVFF